MNDARPAKPKQFEETPETRFLHAIADEVLKKKPIASMAFCIEFNTGEKPTVLMSGQPGGRTIMAMTEYIAWAAEMRRESDSLSREASPILVTDVMPDEPPPTNQCVVPRCVLLKHAGMHKNADHEWFDVSADVNPDPFL